MKQMKIVVLLLLSLMVVGCGLGTTPFVNPNNARVEVKTKIGYGKGAVSTEVKSVGGKYVYSSSSEKYVEVPPGNYTVSYDYEKVIEKGSRLTFTVTVFGQENVISSPHGPTVLSSNFPLKVSGKLEAGKTYYVDATSVFTDSISSDMADYLSPYSPRGFNPTGSAVLRERK